MSKANLKRWAFNLFLKSVMSETVRKSAGREFHASEPENETKRDQFIVASALYYHAVSQKTYHLWLAITMTRVYGVSYFFSQKCYR